MSKASTVAVLIIGLAFEGHSFAQDRLADFIKQFLQQEPGLWTSPLHVGPKDMKWLLPLGISAGALFRTDRNISSEVSEVVALRRPSGIVSRAGSATPMIVAPLALMTLGRLSNSERTSHAGSIGLEAVLHSALIVQTLKTVTNRERPNKRVGDGGFIRTPAVSSKLEMAAGCFVKFLGESFCVSNSALAKMPSKDQFCVALDSDKRVSIAHFRIGYLLVEFVTILTTNESPNLIGFNVSYRYALDAILH